MNSSVATTTMDEGVPPHPSMSKKRMALWVLVAISITAIFFGLSMFVWNDDTAIKETLTTYLEQARGTPWALPVVVGAYVLGGLVFFPIILLNLVVAMVFGLWGIFYGLIGIMTNTAVYFLLGRLMRTRGGKKWLENSKFKWADDKLHRIGLAGLVALHALPAPPFTVMNVIAGISTISTLTYLLGTFLAMLPGAISRGVVGESLTQIILNPKPESFAYLAGGVVLWIVLVGGSHILLKKFQKEEQPKMQTP